MRFRRVSFALIFVTAAFCAQPHGRARTKKRSGQAERSFQPPPVSYDPSVIANPNQPDTMEGDRGSVDGYFGTNLKRTVAAYEAEQHLPNNGVVDAATWAAVNRDSAPPLTNYTITPDDLKGPWVNVPNDMMEQAELSYLGYSSPLEELAERFHSSHAVIKALNPTADFGREGQVLLVPNVLTMPPGQAANVVVSKSESSIRVCDGAGKLIAFYMCTCGSEHDPLPIGDWKILGVRRNPEFHYSAKLFWDARNPDAKAVIKPGPNNPVGVVWIDLSKPHYGIHGTPDPSNIGHTFSHGCIRLTNWDASELADMVKPGTPALLRE
jgi:lipoprotein-anchoring transpeptidase ErfK/SrfK